jgi:hypothetical protein
MTARRILLAWLCVIALAAPVAADVAADHYNRGNRLYEQKDYEAALAAYEATYDAGADDADLFLNLGNAAFRANRLGTAVWAYDMGLRRAPRDADLRFNLRYAEAFQRDELPAGDELLLQRIGRTVARWFTTEEALAVTAAAWLLLGLAVMAWLPSRRRGLWLTLGLAALVVALAFAPLTAYLVHQQLAVKRAVITADQVVVHTAPAPDAAEAFTIHAGLRVQILDERDRYARARIPTGLEGWLPQDTYRTLKP